MGIKELPVHVLQDCLSKAEGRSPRELVELATVAPFVRDAVYTLPVGALRMPGFRGVSVDLDKLAGEGPEGVDAAADSAARWLRLASSDLQAFLQLVSARFADEDCTWRGAARIATIAARFVRRVFGALSPECRRLALACASVDGALRRTDPAEWRRRVITLRRDETAAPVAPAWLRVGATFEPAVLRCEDYGAFGARWRRVHKREEGGVDPRRRRRRPAALKKRKCPDGPAEPLVPRLELSAGGAEFLAASAGPLPPVRDLVIGFPELLPLPEPYKNNLFYRAGVRGPCLDGLVRRCGADGVVMRDDPDWHSGGLPFFHVPSDAACASRLRVEGLSEFSLGGLVALDTPDEAPTSWQGRRLREFHALDAVVSIYPDAVFEGLDDSATALHARFSRPEDMARFAELAGRLRSLQTLDLDASSRHEAVTVEVPGLADAVGRLRSASLRTLVLPAAAASRSEGELAAFEGVVAAALAACPQLETLVLAGGRGAGGVAAVRWSATLECLAGAAFRASRTLAAVVFTDPELRVHRGPDGPHSLAAILA